jgi:uncharacterized protein (DUF1501 family)
MNPSDPTNISRRRFIGQTTCAGFSLTGLLSTMGTLRLFNAALSAQTAPSDYKALVCLFFFGGNDGNNTIIPIDADNYQSYATGRGILALPQAGLIPVPQPDADGRQYGLHQSMAALQPALNAGKLAFVANVGTLVGPITKAEYLSGGAAVPPYLFSHNDQQAQWQTSVPDSIKRVGWGGRLADLMQTLNSGAQISMNISLAGNNFFQVGNEVFQYHVGSQGSIGLSEYNATYSPVREMYLAMNDERALSYGHVFETEYVDILNRAVGNDALLKTTLQGVPMYDRVATAQYPGAVNLFPGLPRDGNGNLTGLAAQLHMILRLIAARSQLSMRRQIFFCSVGGFDTHDDQTGDHSALLQIVSNATAAFYNATTQLGYSDSVTLFSASDFNRTFSTNGKGSDHAWGSHHLVLGGAVNGGRVYGRMPVLVANGPDDTGSRGSWIPTTSVDEYSATLAKWFGVSNTDMPLVLPNIRRFGSPDLGFMT